MSTDNNQSQPVQSTQTTTQTASQATTAPTIPVREFANIPTSDDVNMFKGNTGVDGSTLERKA